MFKKIICPIDFSPTSDQALATASRMAGEEDAELVVLHVGSAPWLVPSRYPSPADLIDALRREDEAGLVVAAKEASRLGAPRVSTRLVDGTAWQEIVRVIGEDPQLDLAVVGAHGRSAIARVLLGSVADKVVRHAPCSVLVVRGRGDAKGYRHVLCPVDFSDSSRQAVEVAAELAVPGGAGILLMHAIDMPVVYPGEIIPPDFYADLAKHTNRVLEEWAEDLRKRVDVPVTTLVETGSPGARAIQMLDRDSTFDLVAVGSQGRTGLRRFLLGSVAERIVRHAPCPVIVARARRAPPMPRE